MKKPTANYWVDVLIGIAFIVSGISGIIFLFPVGPESTPLGIGMRLWTDLHTWGSLALVAGVALHLVLHWKWIVHMTRRRLSDAATGVITIGTPGAAAPSAVVVAAPSTDNHNLSRRAFLGLGGAAAFTAGLAIAGFGSAGGRTPTPSASSGAGSAPSGSQGTADGGASADTASAHGAAQAQGAGSFAAGSPTQPPTAGPTATHLPQAVSGGAASSAGQSGLELADQSQQVKVACRFGVANDPYPGLCRHYVDREGDGICDYSVPGSGPNVATRFAGG